MSVNYSIDERLTNFIDLANDINENIGQIVKDNFEDGNITKGNSLDRPFISFVDSDMENVTLTLSFADSDFFAEIDIHSEECPTVTIKVEISEVVLVELPQEITDYLMED